MRERAHVKRFKTLCFSASASTKGASGEAPSVSNTSLSLGMIIHQCAHTLAYRFFPHAVACSLLFLRDKCHVAVLGCGT